MKNKTHIALRFGITDKFKDADMETILSDIRLLLESKYDDKICGTLEIGYERTKLNPLEFFK